ncbi:hypothetical protein [[Mycobacterium] holstebronense]|uniref:Twin-arginine translocation pathway signal n=1 Tax=[Mycobacterium] holstebronense TaxID=3064288 RepID=A0ABN9NRW1_9MYCO|nr:hypothetical protein [Mycolicibacter sp. MU0102]CAJ1509667.1 hypothetical protein MU0102_003817 [Mycolicibacter sp. MU0102]
MTVDQAPEIADDAGTVPESADESTRSHGETADTAPGWIERTKAALSEHRKQLFLGAVLTVAAVLALVVYGTAYRPARQSDAVAADDAVRAASSATVALLSYSPETLGQDLERARALMAGDFLTYYGKFSDDVVAPAVRTKGIQAAAQVVNAGLIEIRPNDAKVLVFLNQETVSRERREPALTASSVVVSLAKVDSRWLISALDPV